jgi:hypothetical protein
VAATLASSFLSRKPALVVAGLQTRAFDLAGTGGIGDLYVSVSGSRHPDSGSNLKISLSKAIAFY